MAFLDEEQRRRAERAALLRQGIFVPAPQAVQATPASPLPGVPLSVGVISPQSEAAAQPQYDEFAAVRQLLANRADQFKPTGTKEVDEALRANAEMQQAGAQNLMSLISGAQMDPREKAVLEARRARTEKQMTELEEDQKKSGWDALMKAGLAMAQSNSPYFMQALASGIQAGVDGYDASKTKADEKRARLQAQQEDSILSEVKGIQSAQDRILGVYNAALAAGKSEAEARNEAVKSAVNIATLPLQLEGAKLDVEGKRADLALTRARTIDALRPPRSGSSGEDGTPGPRPLPPGARAEAEGKLATAYEAQDEAYRKWVKAGKPIIGQVAEGTKDWEAASTYEAARGKVNNILTTLGKKTLGPAPVRPGKRVTQAQRGAAPARAPARSTGTKPKSFPGTQAVWDAMTPEEKKLFQ